MQTLKRERSKSSKVTPPSSVAVGPLTPPLTDEKPSSRVAEVLSFLRRRREGLLVSDEPWKVIQVSVADWEELHRQLEADELLWNYVEHNVRYDYDGYRERLVFRMSSTLLEAFMRQIDHDILTQLAAFKTGPGSAADFARSLGPRGSPRMKFQTTPELRSAESAAATIARARPLVQHEPDSCFGHRDAQYPGVVIEISYSQKRRDLRHLAYDYIVESDGNVRVVVGLDVEHRGSRSATMSVWRPRVVVNDRDGQEELVAFQTEVNQVFRREDGTTEPSTILSLKLEDFAPQRVVESYTLADEIISLSSETLCRYLEEAEVHDQADKQGVRDALPPRVRKRRRSSTPPEQITSEDEAAIVALEANTAERVLLDDSSYKESSQSSQEVV